MHDLFIPEQMKVWICKSKKKNKKIHKCEKSPTLELPHTDLLKYNCEFV